MDGEGGEVRSIVPGGTQTSSIRVPPIIWRVSASRTPVHSNQYMLYAHTGEPERSAPSTRMRDTAVHTLSRCVESYLHGGRLCGNKSSNLPRNCKVTLGAKFMCVSPTVRATRHFAARKEKQPISSQLTDGFLCFNGEKYRRSPDDERERWFASLSRENGSVSVS